MAEDGSVISTVVDPWMDGRIESDHQLSFDDDFTPVTSAVKPGFVKMPDSNAYLSTLEAKLAQIKGGGKGKENCGQDSMESSKKLIDDLMAVKEGHMSRLMMSERAPQTVDAADQFEPDYSSAPDNPIQPGAFDFLRTRICPERQALTAEELLALIASDFLNNPTGSRTASTGTDEGHGPSNTDTVTTSSVVETDNERNGEQP